MKHCANGKLEGFLFSMGMAKVSGIIELKGKVDDLVFYKLNGQKVCRKRDTEQGERLKTDPRYESCRKTSTLFGACNAMATAIYRMAKMSNVRLDYMRHGELVKRIFNHYHAQGNLPNSLIVNDVFKTLSGMRMDKSRTTPSLRIHTLNDKFQLTVKQHYNCVFITGKWDEVFANNGKYSCKMDMYEVTEVELELDKGSYVFDRNNGEVCVLVAEGAVFIC